jgi:hypothetical protein
VVTQVGRYCEERRICRACGAVPRLHDSHCTSLKPIFGKHLHLPSDGQRGMAVNYQGIGFDTEGSITTDLASRYAPPTPPAKYDQRAGWLQQYRDQVDKATDLVRQADEFALNTQRILPGGLFSSGSKDGAIRGCRTYYDLWLAEHLQRTHAYETDLALWMRTRVCTRCGESFMTDDDRARAREGFERE